VIGCAASWRHWSSGVSESAGPRQLTRGADDGRDRSGGLPERMELLTRAEVERRYEAGHRSFCRGPSICLTQSLLAVNSGTSTGC
jgi:hypothetical protein